MRVAKEAVTPGDDDIVRQERPKKSATVALVEVCYRLGQYATKGD